MQVNTLQRYGLRVMIEIGMDEEQQGLLQKNISASQNISLRYLDHIIRGLKTAGLIRNKGGKKSGYVLTMPASEITTLNIMNAFQADVQIVDCSDSFYECEMKAICSANPFWVGLNDMIKDYFQGVTLQALLQRQKRLNSGIKE